MNAFSQELREAGLILESARAKCIRVDAAYDAATDGKVDLLIQKSIAEEERLNARFVFDRELKAYMESCK